MDINGAGVLGAAATGGGLSDVYGLASRALAVHGAAAEGRVG
ncbi:hypothetical protein OG806_47005 [Streptomyces sp. NBC_00882]|nr:hypothetical protein OG806_47005 [Streptomyces sp. NBC_00882]